MMKKFSMIGAAIAMTAGATITAAPANAQYYGGDRSYSSRDYYRDGAPRYSDRRSYNRQYQRGYANRSSYNSNRSYYGRNSNTYGYRCSNGTTGTVLGAIVGGLLGDAAVGRRGDGTAGAIVGAGVGALAGRAIERSNNRC